MSLLKIKVYLLFFVTSFFGFSQNKENKKSMTTFTQFDLSIPLKRNLYTNQYSNGVQNKNQFLPDGLSAKFGYGIQKNKWIGLSINSGIDWRGSKKFVAIPVFGNLRISPKIGDDYRLTLQLGYGKGFAIGRGNLIGTYKKISLGIETDEDLNLFIEASGYENLKNSNLNSIGNLSLGISLRTF